jgi:predicted ATPase/class 3 adenylate cyclase/DNA-binding CsgD family transcriptional regulator
MGAAEGLPTGTVAFLFTDLEGSTRLLQAHPEAYRGAVARHHALLRAAVEGHGGVVFETVGDAVYAAFARPTDAVAAALAGQLALQREPWGEVGPLRARMGLHHGEVELQDGHYFGAPLYRCARLTATAHGGQVVLSGPAAELVRDALPERATLRDLGEHRLEDLIRPERVSQLVAPDLPADFPPLRVADARPTNLPAQRNPFVGRGREIAAVADLLGRPDVRLLTLTGPGGIGKTRLALRVAADLLAGFEHGVFWVDLAAIGESALVLPSVAEALAVRSASGQPLADLLRDYLRDRTLLLGLDNFEHVLGAAPVVGELLTAAPRLKVLATSRAPLRLYGEQEFAVPALPLPDPHQAPTAEALRRCDSVRLFFERARGVAPDLVLTDENAPAVAAICRRLDGLPLALELAAARVRLLPPQAMVGRLEHRLSLLTGGARDAPPRQRTLRATIAWSHDLLSEPERRLFRRLSVFAGDCALEAAEAVCAEDETDALTALESLLAHSLVSRDTAGPEPRFGMLETIREFARGELETGGEGEAVRRRHAGHFLGLAEALDAQLVTAQRAAALDALQADHDNLRAALAWSLGQTEDRGQVALRLAAAMRWFWYHRGHFGEGRAWLQRALAGPGAPARTAARARALHGAGLLAFYAGEPAAARPAFEESVGIWREVGDRRGLAHSLVHLGVASFRGDRAAARGHEEEAAALFRAAGDRWGFAQARLYFAVVSFPHDDAAAWRALEESRAVFSELGDAWALAAVVGLLAAVAKRRGDAAAARALMAEGLTLARRTGDRWRVAVQLEGSGNLARDERDLPEATDFYREALALYRELGDRAGVVSCLERLAEVAELAGDTPRAARLFGAAEAHRGQSDLRYRPAPVASDPGAIAAARGRLRQPALAAAWAQGRAAALEGAVAEALADAPPQPAARSGGPPPAAGSAQPAEPVSARELEVAALVARGLTNRQIAERLVISVRTVDRHVENLLRKLGLAGRAQIAAWVVERRLAVGSRDG